MRHEEENKALPSGRRLVVSVTAQALLVVGHFAYGARAFDDPSRLHVVGPTLAAASVVAALAWTLRRYPRKAVLAALVAAAAVPFVGVFGLYHGGWEHLVKDLAFLAGAPRATLEWLFGSSDFAYPDDAVFEASGLLTFVLGGWIARLLGRLVREFRSLGRTPRDLAPRSRPRRQPGAGAARLAGLSVRMLFDAPWKSLGTLTGVVVSVFLMAQQTSLLAGILGRVTSFVNGSGVDLWVMSLATESTDATDSIPASRVGVVASTPGVAWAAPVVQGVGKVTRPDGVRENVKVLGVEAPRYAGLPRSLSRGTTADALRASGRILINWNDRPTFASAQPGDRIEIDGKAGIVSGFFEGMDPHSPYYYVFANIDDARALTGFPQDRITYVAVGASPGVTASEVAGRLRARIPEVLVKTRAEFADMEKRYFLVRSPVGLVFGMGSVVAALIGAAIVAVTLYSTAIDRARDYGTLKAIGARRRDLLQLLLVQAWLFCAVGFAIGMSAFFVVRHHFPQLPMVAPASLVLSIAAASLSSCTLASAAAIRRVLQLDPALVFRS